MTICQTKKSTIRLVETPRKIHDFRMNDAPILIIGFSEELEMAIEKLLFRDKVSNPTFRFGSPILALQFLKEKPDPAPLFAIAMWETSQSSAWYSPLIAHAIPWVIAYENRNDRERILALGLGKAQSIRLPIESSHLFEAVRSFDLEWKICAQSICEQSLKTKRLV